MKEKRQSFKENIWGSDLVDMQLISKFNKRFRFLIHNIDIYSKYAWVSSLKDKKLQLLMLFKRFWTILTINQTKYG